MAQRFEELNKNAICFDKNKKSSLFFSRIRVLNTNSLFHKIDGRFLPKY